MWLKRPSVEHCSAVGRALAAPAPAPARLRDAAAPNALSVAGWRPLFAAERTRAPTTVAAGLADEHRGELDFLEAHWPTSLPSGVIHADLFPDNVFFLRRRVCRA